MLFLKGEMILICITIIYSLEQTTLSMNFRNTITKCVVTIQYTVFRRISARVLV